ncbi:hypothetical protein N9V40_02215 [Pseudomonadales bacterium]|nr:hypothetical protein [Pseudomonadales bacterium]
MNTFGILFLCLVVFLIVVMLIFVIGKISELESLTERLLDNKTFSSENAQLNNSGSHEESDLLQGQSLWNSMVNNVQDSPEWADRKKKYEYVFDKHVKHVINMGYQDGLVQSTKKYPSNELVLNMLRGDITSWLPTLESNALYDLAYAASNVMQSDAPSLADAVSNLIFGLNDQLVFDGTVLNEEVLVRLKLLGESNS